GDAASAGGGRVPRLQPVHGAVLGGRAGGEGPGCERQARAPRRGAASGESARGARATLLQRRPFPIARPGPAAAPAVGFVARLPARDRARASRSRARGRDPAARRLADDAQPPARALRSLTRFRSPPSGGPW